MRTHTSAAMNGISTKWLGEETTMMMMAGIVQSLDRCDAMRCVDDERWMIKTEAGVDVAVRIVSGCVLLGVG